MQGEHRDLISFEDVARDFLQQCTPKVERETAWFSSRSLALTDVIERACASITTHGRLHPHQQRPFRRWPQAPKEAADLLGPLENSIKAASDFHCLYTLIVTTLTRVKGVGELGYYDIARRIGKWLRPKLEPTEVYLHRGTREGAKAAGFRINRDRLPMSDLPEGLRLLTPAQAEDALCIYREPLGRIAGDHHGAPRGIVHCGVRPTQPWHPRAGRF